MMKYKKARVKTVKCIITGVKKTRLSRLVAKYPLSRRKTRNGWLSVQLWHDVGQGSRSWASPGATLWAMLCSSVQVREELITKPASTFVSDKLFRSAEVCNPVSFQGCDVVAGLFRVHLTGYQVLGGTVQDGQDGPLLLLRADPEDIGLGGLVEVPAGWVSCSEGMNCRDNSQPRGAHRLRHHGNAASRPRPGLKGVPSCGEAFEQLEGHSACPLHVDQRSCRGTVSVRGLRRHSPTAEAFQSWPRL